MYLVLGMIFILGPKNKIFQLMGYDENVTGFLLKWLLIVGGIYMLIYWIFLVFKNKCVDTINRKMPIIMWILFILIVPIEFGKKVIFFVLSASRQKETAQYIPEFFLSLFFTLAITEILYIHLGRYIVNFIEKSVNIRFSNEFIAFVLVLLIIITFFLMSRIMIISLELSYICTRQKNEIKEKK